jgi:hypothetical protein
MGCQMTLLTQPPDSQSCGQHCVAMIAGVSVEEAIEAVGHDRRTRTKDLRRALEKLGMELGSDRLLQVRHNKAFFDPKHTPKAALCKAVHFPMAVSKKLRGRCLRSFHWVVIYNGMVYDPGPGYKLMGLSEYVRDCMFITSYIEVLNYGENLSMDQKTVYYWELPKDQPDFSGYDDLPTAYRVNVNTSAAGGIIVYAKYGNEWIANPWNNRTIIRQLLIELGKIEP